MSHRHTHIGYLMIVILGIGLLFCLGRPWSFLAIAMLATCLALFPSMSIEVADDGVTRYFGLGLIRKRIALAEIDRVTVVKSYWLRQLGLPRSGLGRLHKLAGIDAVEVRLKTGRTITLGTDRAEELASMINSQSGLVQDINERNASSITGAEG